MIDGFAVVFNTLALLRDRAQIGLKTRTQHCADIHVRYVNTMPAPSGALVRLLLRTSAAGSDARRNPADGDLAVRAHAG